VPTWYECPAWLRGDLQNYAESARRDVEAAGLEPDTICIRNPEAVIFQVGVVMKCCGPSIRIEAVGETKSAVIGICPKN